MAKRGRPRKSLGQHLQEGTFRPERHEGQAEPVPQGKPSMPRGLNANEKWCWKLVTSEPWNGKIDEAQLRQLCATWHCWVEAAREVRIDPLNVRAREAFVKYTTLFDRLAAHFGMNPAARTQIKLPHAPKKDEDEEFFGRMVG